MESFQCSYSSENVPQAIHFTMSPNVSQRLGPCTAEFCSCHAKHILIFDISTEFRFKQSLKFEPLAQFHRAA